MSDDTEAERLRIERERLHVEKLKFLMLAEIARSQRRVEQRAKRSWLDRVEDSIFDW